MARGRGSGKKSGSKPTSTARAHKQEVMQRYTKAREDAQMLGLIPTTPEAALDSERVDPSVQSLAALPEVVRQALRESWATPDSAKPAILAALLESFFKEDEVMSVDGVVVKVKPSKRMLMELAKTLHMLDQTQYDRDHPKVPTSPMGMPGAPTTNNTTNVYGDVVANKIDVATAIREAISRGELGIIEELPPPDKSSPPGLNGQQREVETSTPPETD